MSNLTSSSSTVKKSMIFFKIKPLPLIMLLGNCTPLDNTAILNAYGEGKSAVYVASKYDLVVRDPVQEDHDYYDLPFEDVLSDFKKTCVTWISGATVKALSDKVKCEVCVSALSSPNSAVHDFIWLKNRGNLKSPSQSVITICTEAEKCFQRLEKINDGLLPQGYGFPDAVSHAVLTNTSHIELFSDLKNHQFDTTVFDNHRIHLIKKVAWHYIKIRMYHLGKTKTRAMNGPKVRYNLSKLIQFKHQ